jgi:hypothetical protein
MYEIVEMYATFENGQDLYLDIFTSKEEAKATGLMVEKGYVILSEDGYVAADTNDIYFDYSEAVDGLVSLESVN